MTVRTTPYQTRERLVADLGVYAQDSWTLKRMTLNAGVRFDYLNNKVEAQSAPGGRWIGPRQFDEISDVPSWKDVAPRLGVAYDLFGNGKTALKATLSRYVQTSTVGFARALNPFNTTVNTATRTWNDLNGDGVPQDAELGPLGSTFGQRIVSTTYDPDVVTGRGKRRYNWEYSGSITQQLRERVSAELAYFHRSQGNFLVTDNRDVGPADYDPYCVTAPVDPRLPNGGGYQICGLYDLNSARFGAQFADDLVVTFADNFGKQTQTFDGFDLIVNARPRSGLILNGGFSTGIDATNNCDLAVVDSPQAVFCDQDTGWQTSAKASVSYTLPWREIQLGAVFQNLPGQAILASWNIVSSQAEGLGRPFSGGGSRTIQLIEPGSLYADRRSQLDLRIAKAFKIRDRQRLQVMLDVYNAFNSNAPVGATSQAGETPPALNTTYSPPGPASQWLVPLNILQARYVKFGAQFRF